MTANKEKKSTRTPTLVKTICLSVVIACLFAGCAATNQWVKVSPSFNSNRTGMKNIAVVSDAALAILSGDKYYSGACSFYIDSMMLDGIVETLKVKGYSAFPVPLRITGCFLDTQNRLLYRSGPETGFITTRPPFIKDTADRQLSPFEYAIRTLLAGAYRSLTCSAENQDDTLQKVPGISHFCAMVRDSIKTDYLLVHLYHGFWHIPSNLEGAVTLGVAAVSVALMGSMVVVNQEGGDASHYSILIDLRQEKIAWSKLSSGDQGDIFYKYGMVGYLPKSVIYSQETLKKRKMAKLNTMDRDTSTVYIPSRKVYRKFAKQLYSTFPKAANQKKILGDELRLARPYPARKIPVAILPASGK